MDPHATVQRTFSTEKRGEKVFLEWLPDDWVPRKQDPDFFIDYVVEIVEAGEPTGRHFAAQIKGTKRGKKRSITLSYAAKIKHARYWLHDCQQPVFVFLIDTETRSGHWLFAQKFLREKVTKVALDKQTRVTIRFSQEDDLSNSARFLSALMEAEQYVRNLHPGTIQAAIENKQRELAEREPRCSYQITATEGVQTVHVSAKEPFSFGVLVQRQHAELVQDRIQRAMDHGGEVTLPLDQLKFKGSPLFEQFSEQARGSLTLRFGEEVPGSMILRPVSVNPVGLQVEGLYRIGAKTAAFRGELNEAPFAVGCVIDISTAPIAPPPSLKLSFPLDRWQGQPVLHLAYFAQVQDILRQLTLGTKLEAELFVKGNLLFPGEVTGQPDSGIKRFLEIVDWIDRCRSVARHYGINPSLPQWGKIAIEEWEAIDDLFSLMSLTRIATSDPGLSARLTFREAPQRGDQFPNFGCLCFENENAMFKVLRTPVQVGRLRWILTNVNIEPLTAFVGGRQQVKVTGTDSTIRILERF